MRLLNNLPLQMQRQVFPTPSRYNCHKPPGLFWLRNDLLSNKEKHATSCVSTWSINLFSHLNCKINLMVKSCLKDITIHTWKMNTNSMRMSILPWTLLLLWNDTHIEEHGTTAQKSCHYKNQLRSENNLGSYKWERNKVPAATTY